MYWTVLVEWSAASLRSRLLKPACPAPFFLKKGLLGSPHPGHLGSLVPGDGSPAHLGTFQGESQGRPCPTVLSTEPLNSQRCFVNVSSSFQIVTFFIRLYVCFLPTKNGVLIPGTRKNNADLRMPIILLTLCSYYFFILMFLLVYGGKILPKDQQTFSIKGQIVNILSFVGQRISVATIYSALVTPKQP